jgi:hypothetical protein
MQCSRSLNKFKKVIAAATVLATISCLVPESAQAILLRFSGSPNGGASFLDFTLDTSVPPETTSDSNVVLFPEAIQDAEYRCTGEILVFPCTNEDREFSFLPGTLRASRITTETDVNRYPGSNSLFIGGVKYEATLNSQSSSDFIEVGILVIQSSSFDLINSLSALGNLFPNNDGSVSVSYVGIAFPYSKESPFIGAGNRFKVVSDVEVVPDPDATRSLLGVGAIGAVLRLKRIKRSRKFQGSQNAAVATQELA